MKTNIYACYLPGSVTPDYIGSHNADPDPKSQAQQWMYQYHTYVGAGAWVSRSGCLRIPNSCAARPWGALLTSMSEIDRKNIRVEVLAQVEAADRWQAEAEAIRKHQPPFNVALKEGKEGRRRKWNAYQRGYRKGYLERNPDKAQAKRDNDRIRVKARRAEAKAAKIAQGNAPVAEDASHMYTP